MDIEEIDSNYSSEISKANEFFLNGLKNKKDKKELGKKFKLKLSKANKVYNKNVEYYLKHKKKEKKPKKVEKVEGDKKPEFKEDKYIEYKKKIKIFIFIKKIEFKRFKENYIPNEWGYNIKKIKVILKHRFFDFIHFLEYKKSRSIKKLTQIREDSLNRYQKMKEKINNIIKRMKEKINQIKEKLKPKKVEKVESDKPQEEKQD